MFTDFMLQVPGGRWIQSRSVLALFMRRIHVLKCQIAAFSMRQTPPKLTAAFLNVLCCGDSWALCLLQDETMYLYIEQQPFLRAKHCRNKSPCSQTLAEFSRSATDGRPSLSSNTNDPLLHVCHLISRNKYLVTFYPKQTCANCI